MEANAESKSYNAIAYYRLSKDDGQKNESDSIANQRLLICDYVSKNENITLVNEAFDDGYTGTNYDRPGFQKVLECIKNGEVNCVIVKDLSRLGREYIETGKYLEMIFPSFGVRFIAINDDVDSDQHNSGNDILIPIKNIINDSYCRELSNKLRKQFEIQRQNGEFLGSFASYGYCKAPDDKHKLVIDPYAAEVVKMIYELKLKGYSNQAIADYLNQTDVLSPSEYKKSRGLKYESGFKAAGKAKWSPVAVRRILTNQVYIGHLIQGKRSTPNYKIRKSIEKKPEDWSVVKNTHDAIIERWVFNTIQNLLQRDTRRSPEAEVVHLLSGLIFCADCGRTMCRRSVQRGKKKHFYYVCTTYKRGAGCTSHNIQQGSLENVVLHAIQAQINCIVELDALIKDISPDKLLAAKIRRLELLIEEKEHEINKYKNFKMKLYESMIEEIIDHEEYLQMRQRYGVLLDKALLALYELNEQLAKVKKDSVLDKSWIKQFVQYQNINILTRDVIVSLVDKIFISEDKHVLIEFNFRDEFAYYKELIQSTSMEVAR